MSVLRLKSDHAAAVSDTKPTKIKQQQQYSEERLALMKEQARQQQQQQHQM